MQAGPLTPLVQQWFGQSLSLDDPMLYLQTAFSFGGIFIHLKAGTRLGQPLLLRHHVQNRYGMVPSPRLLLVVEEGASLTLFEEYSGDGSLGSTCWLHGCHEIILHPGATLQHTVTNSPTMQPPPMVLHQYTRQAASSCYTRYEAIAGRPFRQVNLNAALVGPGATHTATAIYLPNGYSGLSTRFIHQANDTTSSERFYGMVGDLGQLAIYGGASIEQGSTNVSINQDYNALLLAPNSSFHTRPQLSIANDEVRATHSVRVAPISEEAISYMATRAIRREVAIHALVQGYLESALNQTPQSFNDFVRFIFAGCLH
jgi:Fe-S cluster assembly protein SufD